MVDADGGQSLGHGVEIVLAGESRGWRDGRRVNDEMSRGVRGRSGLSTIALLACFVLTLLLCQKQVIAEEVTPLESVQIMSGKYGKGGDAGVIGHLGGIPVSIPKEFANFVEYDGDPGFLEKRSGSMPKRTFESGIRSFGFEIRYPDMVPVNEQNWKEKRKDNIYTTVWMSVGVLSNSYYQDRSNTRFSELAKAWLKNASIFYRYEEVPEKVYGLTTYAPANADLSRREIDSNNSDFNDKNIYIHRLRNGNIDAYIDCSNTKHDAALCKHRFGLEPILRASVNVSYRKGLLPHWQEIQNGISQVLLGFRTESSKQFSTQHQIPISPSKKTQE